MPPTHLCRRGGVQALSTGSAGGSNHTAGLATQHFLSAESCVSSAAVKSEVSAPEPQKRIRRPLLRTGQSAEERQGQLSEAA